MRLGLFTLSIVLCLSGCPSKEPEATQAPPPPPAPVAPTPPPAAPAAADPKAEAQEIFNLRCTPCHGAQGKGDGPASASLVPKPRDYTLKEWQGSVTDEHIEKIIMYGGAAVGKSPAMPANPDLVAKPDVVKALREIVRRLGG